MNRFIPLLALLGIFSSGLASVSAFADSRNAVTAYHCEAAYAEKLERIAKHYALRDYGKFALRVLVLGVGSAGWVAYAYPLTPLLASPLAAATLLGFGVVLPIVLLDGDLEQWSLDREDGLIAAQALIWVAQFSEPALQNRKHEEKVVAEIAKQNQERDRFGHPHLTPGEEDQVRKTIPFEERGQTLVDLALAKVNRKRVNHKLSPLTYDELRAEILVRAQDDTYCPANFRGKPKPQTMWQIVRKLKNELSLSATRNGTGMFYEFHENQNSEVHNEKNNDWLDRTSELDPARGISKPAEPELPAS